MIKPIAVDLEVDVTLVDGFYYYSFFYSQEKLGFTKSYLHFVSKSYKWVWDFRTLAHFQGSEISLDGIYKQLLLLIVTSSFHICTS